LRNAIGERRTFDQFEHQYPHATRFFEAVDGGDIGMIERREDLCLTLEAREAIRIEREGLRQDLQRDVAIQFRIARAIDLTHAAGPERRLDFIRAEASARGQA
jgi:hypothetical protein